MDLAILVNDLETLRPGMTTVSIRQGLEARGHTVRWVPVTSLGLGPDGRVLPLDGVDGVVIRTSPGRDGKRAEAHAAALDLLERVDVPVLNDPSALRRTGSKLWLTTLPERLRPRTLLTRDPERVRAFLVEQGTIVVKPLLGTGGRGVMRLRRTDRDKVAPMVELLGGEGLVMAQEYLPDAKRGDTRVLVLEGQVLGAVHRVPGKGEARSNVSKGGSAKRAALSDAQRAAVDEIVAVLAAEGLFFAGIDLIGCKAVEVNVFAPGGLDDAAKFSGRDLVSALCERIEARIAAG